jgi:hypothetical protein
MARLRDYIRVRRLPDVGWRLAERRGGTEVPGVSYHRPTAQFYTIPWKGQRTYLGPNLPPSSKGTSSEKPSWTPGL